MTKRGNYLLLLLTVIALVSACTQQRTPCYEPTIVSVSIGTYRMIDGVEGDTSLIDPRFYCLDTPLQFVPNANNSFSAILSPFSDNTRWVLIPDNEDSIEGTPVELFDTLTFYHTKKLTFLSNACGYVNYFTIDNITSTYNSIDSFVLVNSSVDNNANTQHVKIFY